MQEQKIKLLLANDHAILRQGLHRILEAEPDMKVVGEARTGTDTVKLARQLRPDIVIMDVSMPEQDGIESLRQISSFVKSRVLILSIHAEHQVISEAIAAGAAGYLGKDAVDHELVAAVRTVARGGSVYSANVSQRLAESLRQGATAPVTRPIEALTTREREVFLMLAEGKSTGEVARTLFVSPKTVHTHRQNLMGKLGLKSTAELIRFALRHNLTDGL